MPENQNTVKSIEKFLTELDVRIRARYPLININTYEKVCARSIKDLVFEFEPDPAGIFNQDSSILWRFRYVNC